MIFITHTSPIQETDESLITFAGSEKLATACLPAAHIDEN
jgi:hypothetical protein